MNAPLPAREKLVALLEGVPAPVRQAEIAALLGWKQPMVSKTLVPLVEQERVLEFHAPGRGCAGPRPRVYQAASRSVIPPAARRALRVDTIVVTPSDRTARVLFVQWQGFVEIEVFGVRPRSDALVEVWWALLRPFQAGRERPQPARVPASA